MTRARRSGRGKAPPDTPRTESETSHASQRRPVRPPRVTTLPRIQRHHALANRRPRHHHPSLQSRARIRHPRRRETRRDQRPSSRRVLRTTRPDQTNRTPDTDQQIPLLRRDPIPAPRRNQGQRLPRAACMARRTTRTRHAGLSSRPCRQLTCPVSGRHRTPDRTRDTRPDMSGRHRTCPAECPESCPVRCPTVSRTRPDTVRSAPDIGPDSVRSAPDTTPDNTGHAVPDMSGRHRTCPVRCPDIQCPVPLRDRTAGPLPCPLVPDRDHGTGSAPAPCAAALDSRKQGPGDVDAGALSCVLDDRIVQQGVWGMFLQVRGLSDRPVDDLDRPLDDHRQ